MRKDYLSREDQDQANIVPGRIMINLTEGEEQEITILRYLEAETTSPGISYIEIRNINREKNSKKKLLTQWKKKRGKNRGG